MTGFRSREIEYVAPVVSLELVREQRRREAVRKAIAAQHPCAQHLTAGDDVEGDAS